MGHYGLATEDPRRSIAARYDDRQDYLDQVQRAAQVLVRERFLLPDDVPEVLQYSGSIWDTVVGR